MNMTPKEALIKQQVNIEKLEKTAPDSIRINKRQPEVEIFRTIGIWNMSPDRPLGFLRLHNEDFIVEEKTRQGTVTRIDDIDNTTPTKPEDNNKNLFAHLIKYGSTTNAAIDRVSDVLELKKQIGHAGLKDERALTSQLISLPALRPGDEEILKAKIPKAFLTKLQYHDDYLRPGFLQGNYFTIVIRTKDTISEPELAIRLQAIEQFGILNYYQKQRFGGLRLENHNVGKLLAQGRFELAVKYILFKTTDYEMPIIRDIKKQAEAVFPDYSAMIKIFEKLPFSFFYELKLVEYLKDNPNNFIGALNAIKESATICVYAYASLLFNKYLSVYTKEHGCVDEEFPLLISPDRKDQSIYQEYLKEDKTENFYENLKKLKFIYFAKRKVVGRMQVQDIKYKIFNGGVVISFYLSKGSYATTFLANLFELIESDPVPRWVSADRIDSLQIMGRPGLGKLKEIFKDYWDK